MKTVFAKRLRLLRISNHETQQDLADALQVTRGMISHWEQGRYYPEMEKAIEIAEHFGVGLDSLTGISVPSENSRLTLSEDERAVLDMYKTLSPEHKRDVCAVLKTFLGLDKNIGE